MVMKPNRTLYKYQIAYHALNPNGGTGEAGLARCPRLLRQWRRCLIIISLLMLLIFCFWSLQTTGGSSYMFENATERPSFANTENDLLFPSMITENPTVPTESPTQTPANWTQNSLVSNASLVPVFGANFSMPPTENGLLPDCPNPPSNLVGPIPVWMDSPSMPLLEQIYPQLGDGGHGWPENCHARNRVAIVIPYRDREEHLRIFLHNIHAFLRKQQLDYAIFVVEQVSNQTFNRGKLMNVGFVEASRLYGWHCFVFHDVDLLPEDDRNLYTCPQQPRHMSVAVDKFNYKLPYSTLFGGAEALTNSQFTKMNGFSNDFWGWGGEDDDISARIIYAGFSISRYPTTIARYKMIKHEKENLNPVNDCRHALLGKTKKRWRKDGLSNLNYRVISTRYHRLYTKISVDLLEEQSRRALSQENIKKGC